MRRLAVVLLLLALPAVAAGAPDPPSCDIAPQFVTAQKPLTQVKAAIDAGGPVEILAVGSGSTTGANGRQPDSAFPYRMLDALRAAAAARDLRLSRCAAAAACRPSEMLPLVKAQMQQTPAKLVLWQTGTVEAIRGLRPARMRQVLREGLDLIHAAGGSLVLIDPQFTRALRANTDVEPYETELQQVAALPGGGAVPSLRTDPHLGAAGADRSGARAEGRPRGRACPAEPLPGPGARALRAQRCGHRRALTHANGYTAAPIPSGATAR